MATPKDFIGKFTFQKTSKQFDFLPGDGSEETFDVWFYRREDHGTIKEFLDSLNPENMGYDKPSNQLFYRSPSGKLYRMDFVEVK